MAKTEKKDINKDNPRFKRQHQLSLLLNDYEMQALNRFCAKYKVKNKSKFMRETIVSAILKKFDQDYPTLFDPQHISEVNKTKQS